MESDWVSKESSDGIYLVIYTEMLFLIQKPVIMLDAVSLIVNCTVTLVETRLELTLVVNHLQKRFRKIRLESKWITTPWIVPAENLRWQRNIWKGRLVFADGMLQTEIRLPFLQSHLWYKFQAFAAVFRKMELTCLNGKRYSGTKFTSPDMLWYVYSLFLDYLRNVHHHHLLQCEVSFLYILFSLLHTFR